MLVRTGLIEPVIDGEGIEDVSKHTRIAQHQKPPHVASHLGPIRKRSQIGCDLGAIAMVLVVQADKIEAVV